MSKSNKRRQLTTAINEQKLFFNDPVAFANYAIRVNLLEGGSEETKFQQLQLKNSLTTENILNDHALLFQLLTSVLIHAN